MLFRQKELLRWLGVSVFEIWVWLVSLTVFSVLLVLKVLSTEGKPNQITLTNYSVYFVRLKDMFCPTT